MNLKTIEWLGALTGLVGSALLALHVVISGYGFVLFLISNLFWFWFGFRTRAWGMVTMQVGYTLTSVVGIVRWMS
ncbi:hypothetical protein G3A43_06280 [Paraburkholderia aspalathi]|nr:hypothetical protein [Paraburkholderia aspalathi]MBK3779855.1 hypothetical protein [Paraburkholderia aspalathi]